jgi:branched-subunit amino acid aminotransferase/4-amino-4-deoxychorismate lyase
VEPEILVTVAAPAEAQHDPFRVLPVHYERETPHIKHLATYGLLRHVREARVAGYDDALFVDGAGMLSEGSTWNLCMYDGEQWLWPDANVLTGITMLLLRRAMQEEGVITGSRPIRASDLTGFTAAFATNSVSAARPLAAIGERAFLPMTSVQALLRDLHESIEWQPI